MLGKPAISYDDFYKLDVRVARVAWAGNVEGAERLLKLVLDVGELGERTVVMSLKPSYTTAMLLGKRVLYLANIRAKRVRGIQTHGTLLVAAPYNTAHQEYETVLIFADKSILPGTIIR